MTARPFQVGDSVVVVKYDYWTTDVFRVAEGTVTKVWPSGKFAIDTGTAVYDARGRYWGRLEAGKLKAAGHIGARDANVVHNDEGWARRWAIQQNRNECYRLFDMIQDQVKRMERKFPPSRQKLEAILKATTAIDEEAND